MSIAERYGILDVIRRRDTNLRIMQAVPWNKYGSAMLGSVYCKKSEIGLRTVISRSVAYSIVGTLPNIVNTHLQSAKLGIGESARRIVCEQVLRTQFITDLVKSTIQLSK